MWGVPGEGQVRKTHKERLSPIRSTYRSFAAEVILVSNLTDIMRYILTCFEDLDRPTHSPSSSTRSTERNARSRSPARNDPPVFLQRTRTPYRHSRYDAAAETDDEDVMFMSGTINAFEESRSINFQARWNRRGKGDGQG